MDTNYFRQWPGRGHTGGAPDPRVINNNLVIFHEELSGEYTPICKGEDIFYAEYRGAGWENLAGNRYIGDGTTEGRRVAPRVLYVPEQHAYVMWHGVYAQDWDYAVSTSNDLLHWTKVATLITNCGPHKEVVRIKDTIYIFGGGDDTLHQGGLFGYFTQDVNDLSTISAFEEVTLPEYDGTFTGSMIRCDDGWLLMETATFGPVKYWRTTVAAFPYGWEYIGENILGFEQADEWSSSGHRNPTGLIVGGVPMMIFLGRPAGGGFHDTAVGFYRLNMGSTFKRVPIDLSTLFPRETLSTESTDWANILPTEYCSFPIDSVQSEIHLMGNILLKNYAPIYDIGTVSVDGSGAHPRVVVGKGTMWDTNFDGRIFQISGDSQQYIVASVEDANHLTLTEDYIGTAVDANHSLSPSTSLRVRQYEEDNVLISWENKWPGWGEILYGADSQTMTVPVKPHPTNAGQAYTERLVLEMKVSDGTGFFRGARQGGVSGYTVLGRRMVQN
jgi:hypothetical protein